MSNISIETDILGYDCEHIQHATIWRDWEAALEIVDGFIELHIADRARKEVEHRNGIEIQVTFQIKTPCIDLDRFTGQKKKKPFYVHMLPTLSEKIRHYLQKSDWHDVLLQEHSQTGYETV